VYTLQELQKKPAPDGIDPSKKETYLSYADFKKTFGMTYEDYNKEKGWKQQELKKKFNLY